MCALPFRGARTSFVIEALSCIPSPRALGLALRLQYGATDDLKDRLRFNPRYHLDHDTARYDLLSIELIRKWKDLPGSSISSRVAAALSGDIDTERQCAATNARLRAVRENGSYSDLAFISKVQCKIQRIIGAAPVGWERHVNWGPGATATLSSVDAVLDNKLLEKQLSVTSSALVYARTIMSEDLHWLRARLGQHVDGPTTLLSAEFSLCDANRMETVPKDAFKDRLICCEPTLNIFLQKGVGSLLRDRLKQAGCNLNDQTRNQRLARSAYKAGLCTVDLASASDTLSRETVYALLPPCWVELLDDLRSPLTVLPLAGGIRHARLNQKFSSMGNGFTFELESLIFYAIASVVDDSPLVGVYGDDIIVSAERSSQLIQWLAFFGFSTNVQKTYVEGCYYESCGKHFFKGFDITPVYQKAQLTTEIELVRFHNRLYRWWGMFGSILFKSVLRDVRRKTDARIHESEEGDAGCCNRHIAIVRHKAFQRRAFKSIVFNVDPVRNSWYVPDAYLAVVLRYPGYTTDGAISDGLPFRSSVRLTKKVAVRPCD